MHPRNIYKESGRAIQHAEKHPLLSKCVKTDSKGKKRLDVSDNTALRQLSSILLSEDFDLEVDFPPEGLIPTIPLRLNYILWLEDLLKECGRGDDSLGSAKTTQTQISGIDIGTGGSAIYALLAARKNNWKMTGTEINADSLLYARRNVERNKLQSLVNIVEGKQTNLFGVVFDEAKDQVYDFCMCNPPFFCSEDESVSYRKPRTANRSLPSIAKSGNTNELIVEGGESKFINDMINESVEYKQNVRIFSTMVGVKSHVKSFISLLQQLDIHNFTTTEFCQGKTTRWGLAWSFYSKACIDLKSSECIDSAKQFVISVPLGRTAAQTLIEGMCNDLKLARTHCREDEGSVTMDYVAVENTWSNMRRKRRLEEFGTPAKRFKSDTSAVSEPSDQPQQLHLAVKLNSVSPTKTDLALSYLSGTFGREGVHQLVQYFKNFLSKREQCQS